MSFIDKCKIYIKAGNGGDGLVAWRKEAHVPLGGPAGGNGGNGGDVYFVGDHNENSLEHLRYKKKFVAADGEKAGNKNMHGRNAEDVYIKVPLGTIVYDAKTHEVIADILEDKKSYLIARGGQGGHGNFHFKSSFNKAPTLYELGELGEEFELELELKEIADIGIVGLPNAGKSTLISKLTNAKPKIGDYQFTTLVPILGIWNIDDHKIIIADIPGLIEGAAEGVGLGHEFLRHIERCRFLIHLVSLADVDHPEGIEKSYKTIMDELKKYNQALVHKKMLLVVNKADVPEAKTNLEKLKKVLKLHQEVFEISALNNENIDTLKDKLYHLYLESIKETTYEIVDVHEWKQPQKKFDPETLSHDLEINELESGIFEVKSAYLKYWSHRIPLNTPDNLIRFNQKLENLQLEEKLKSMGAKKGDTIKIYNVEINYED